jgi:hypothetical protein
VDRGLLVGRLLEAEAGGEGLVVVRLEAEGVALACRAACVQVQQLGGRVAHLLGGLAPGLFPLAGAQLVQRRFLGADARVAADEMQLRDRHVQRGLVGVLQVQELAGPPLSSIRQVDVPQPDVAPDAVVHVHHRVTHLQLRQVLDERVDVAHLLLLALAPRGGRSGEELGLGDELDRDLLGGFVPEEAFGDGRRRNGEALVALLELGQRRDAGRLDPVVAQQLEQAFAAAFALGHDQHAVRRVGHVPLQLGQRLGRAAVHRQVGQRPRPVHGFAAAHGQRGMRLREREELLRLQEELFRRQDRALPVVLQETMPLARVGPEALQRLVDLAVQRQHGVVADVVEDRRRAIEEQRQVVLDARGGDACRDVLVQPHLGRVALELLAPARAECGARGLVHRELAAREQPHLGHRVQAALAVRIEGADGVHLVAEQVHAVGHR